MYDTRTPWLDNSCATTESIKKSHDILIFVVEENFMCKLNQKKSIYALFNKLMKITKDFNFMLVLISC